MLSHVNHVMITSIIIPTIVSTVSILGLGWDVPVLPVFTVIILYYSNYSISNSNYSISNSNYSISNSSLIVIVIVIQYIVVFHCITFILSF